MLAGLQNVTFEFGARPIITDVNWQIFENERIGLIGYNGTGKSTILKLLTGGYTPTKGTIEKSKETTIGYLHQDLLSLETEQSILEVAKGAFEKVLAIQAEITELEKQLEHNATDELAIKYSEKLHDFEVLGGYEIDYKTEEVLQGLGFKNTDLQKPFKTFSGGWRMRVILAKMILAQPHLLLLDEPTNHLDLPSIEWLEKYLQHYQGSVIIVSHDKYFLNRMVTKIVEVYQQDLHFYTGNYDYYEQEKALRLELQQRAFENQQDFIRQQERFIERFKAKASKAAQAQSAMKRLDKIERIEEAMLERPEIRINFVADVVPGKMIVELNDISKAYGDNVILDTTSAHILRGDKIALLGANGKGKSTLLRIVANMEAHQGERKWGHNVNESFYAQHQIESLNIEDTLLAELVHAGTQKTEQELRNLLGCFLFGGDDVDKKIKVLSGGEKARVALAKVIISKANFLMLDEPTNHLDLVSIDLLIEALNKYNGTFILVSHDRYFVSKTANKFWEIEDGKILEFSGTYEEYVEWKNKRLLGQTKQAEPAKAKPVEVVQEAPKPVAINKEEKKEQQKLQKKFEQVEQKLEQVKAKKTELELSLSDPAIYSDATKFKAAEEAYKKISTEFELLNKEYEALFEQML
jgi:ATP-binding cassette, subfamily F, member 3